MTEAPSTPSLPGTPDESELLARVVNRVGVLTLNRPKALNALTHDMVIAMAAQLARWRSDPGIVAVLLHGAGERGFCAGGDVRLIHRLYTAGDARWRDFFIDEYRLDHAIHRFPKPIAILMDGIVMGGGMGLAQGAQLRIATERTRIAMPETRIGMVPDVGATYFLSRLPGALGQYLALTGALIGGTDAVLAGLADVCVKSETLAGWEAALDAIEWRDDPYHDLRCALVRAPLDVGATALLATLPMIHRHFGVARRVDEIFGSLAGDDAAHDADWVKATLATFDAHSPLMLEVTREAVLRGRRLDLADCFRQELCVVSRAIEEGDFIEGVRARLIDKDDQPRWRHASIGEVGADEIARFFVPPWGDRDDPLREL